MLLVSPTSLKFPQSSMVSFPAASTSINLTQTVLACEGRRKDEIVFEIQQVNRVRQWETEFKTRTDGYEL